MEALLRYDARAIFHLQNYLYPIPHMETVATATTNMGAPHYSYVVIFPLAYWLLGATAGHHVLLTAGIAEWFNIVLKWLLLGNRPYWWVWLHTDWPHLLHQSPATCETGPGNPSGHVMITLSVLLTCADYVERWREVGRGRGRAISDTEENARGGKKVDSGPRSTCRNKRQRTETETASESKERENCKDSQDCDVQGALVLDNGWFHVLRTKFRILVWLVISAIAVSRLLISTHFVYQVLCGVVVGVTIHRLLSRYLIAPQHASIEVTRGPRISSLHILALSLLMIIVGVVLFHVWTWLGMDPGFSIPLAERFCVNKAWVRLDTTPFFSLTRCAGTIGGVAFMTIFRPLTNNVNSPRACWTSGVGIVFSFILIGCLGAVPMATEPTMFYVQSLCVCAAVPVVVGGVEMVMGRL